MFNTILGWFGLGPLPWLQNAATAMPSIVIEATWAAAGGTVIIYLAALTGVRPELYDAAEVDGASIWQKIRYITLPQLRNVLFLTLILQLHRARPSCSRSRSCSPAVDRPTRR